MTFREWFNTDAGEKIDLFVSLVLAAISLAGGMFILTALYYLFKVMASGDRDTKIFFGWVTGIAALVAVTIVATRLTLMLSLGTAFTVGFIALTLLLVWDTIGFIFIDHDAPPKPPLFD